jgi:hypothetical protein
VDDEPVTIAPQQTIIRGEVSPGRIAPTTVLQKPPAVSDFSEEQDGFISEREPPLAGPGAARPSLGTPVPVKDRSNLSPTGFEGDGSPEGRLLGHDELYQSIVGRLELQSAGGGMWVVRYGGREDRYGGALALSTVEDMKDYHPGQLVAVQGEILGARPAAGLGLPIFRVQTISPVAAPR